MEPITREEKLMAGEQLEPITRKEYFLAKAAGMDVETPEPITREEMFLSMISGGGTGGSGGGDDEWFNDGDTHIWITLQDGRTSPMLGVCPNGTVTVDWGDGTAPDVLTGTSTSTVRWTPNHNYAEPGDYVVRLSVDGEMGVIGADDPNGSYILCHASGTDNRDKAYRNAVRKVELGNGVTKLNKRAFGSCFSLESVIIPEGVTSIGEGAFSMCYSLTSVVIPNSVTSIEDDAFKYCRTLYSIVIPESVKNIEASVFEQCNSLAFIVIPEGVTRISSYSFQTCSSLVSVVIPGSVKNLGYGVFNNCRAARYVDFSNHTAVLPLPNTNVFDYTSADLEIRVPAALYDEWIAATNWATYASKIVAV